MVEPGAVCVYCGNPAVARSGIFNKVYKCRDCYDRDERRGWLFALIGCGGCLGIIALVVLTGCGVAVALAAIAID